MPLYAGFDLGGTQLKYGLIDDTGQTVYHSKKDSPLKILELIKLIEKILKDLSDGDKFTISSVGFGFPGVLNQKEQKIHQSPNYPDIDHFDLVPALSRFIKVPFTINNDANMAAFGEYKMGAGQGVHSMVLLTIGTGLGTGIILEGKIWQGVCGFGGELGHAAVNSNGEPCNCGSRGCLETEVSAPKIVKNYQRLNPMESLTDAAQVYEKALSGEKAAQEAFSMAGRYLGIGLSIVINLLNPEKILLGGGVMKAGDFLVKPAIQEAQKRSFKAGFDCCRIESATLGNHAGFIGSAFYAKENRIRN
ncbi:MAG: ROK family protein [Candidatus Aminicenantes bacterium]|nr:ROK family protein [Candidatus Aminicenantes bacterium]